MTHANLCRPIHYFIVAHSSGALKFSEDDIRKLMDLLEKDGFSIVAGDHTGIIVSCNLQKTYNLLRELKFTGMYFFPTTLNVSITADGLFLISLFGWYSGFDIAYGKSRKIDEAKYVLKYLEKMLEKVARNNHVEIRIIRGIRECLFEHPGAYIGHF